MRIESKKQITELRTNIYDNAMKTYSRIAQDIANDSLFTLFADMKFNKYGVDPIKGTPLNFIEQLNQMFSDFVLLYAVEELLSKYPDNRFEVNFGARAGFDIASCDQTVVAECFAVTNVDSNSKLSEDAKKLTKLPENVNKYIYFYSQNDKEEKLKKIYRDFSDITFRRIEEFD